MFLINSRDIYSKECQIKIGRDGIDLIYQDKTIEIPINKLKRFLSHSTNTTKKYSHYELLEENKIVIIGRIDDVLKELNFYTDENCDIIVHWLRKNVFMVM